MNDRLESAKNTVKDHPTETVAAVAVLVLFGTIFYFKSKQRKVEIQRSHCVCPPPPRWMDRFWSMTRRKRYSLEFAA